MRGLREAIYDLRPSDEAPFPQMVEEMVRRYRELTPEREIALVVEEGFPSDLPRDASIQLLRLVREALSNARRHSAARCVWVTLGAGDGGLEVEVADDGRGFVAGAEAGGMASPRWASGPRCWAGTSRSGPTRAGARACAFG